MNEFKSFGKLIYNPHTHLNSNKNWLVLMCDDEISKYYCNMFYKEFPWKGKLKRPVWGAHISVIRGEKIPNIKLWGLNSNQIIEYTYTPGVLDNSEYFWLNAKCPVLSNLREKYGLYKEPKFGFHLTIGRVLE